VANVRQGNSHWVEATGSLESSRSVVYGVIVTATAASAVVVIQDSAGSNTKLDLRVATSGESKHFDFSHSPISFPKGINVSTLTNAKCMVIYESA
jgi:hypothetical protein